MVYLRGVLEYSLIVHAMPAMAAEHLAAIESSVVAMETETSAALEAHFHGIEKRLDSDSESAPVPA